MNRTEPGELLDRLKRAGVWSKKRFGQHFLIDRTALEAIIKVADLQPSDVVLEIGPGLGVLSEQLLSRVGTLVACELDEDMVLILNQDLPKLKVVQGDVLATAHSIVASFPVDQPYKVVANIPYQITSPLLRLFLEGEVGRRPKSITLLVQKEVGKRLAAPARHSDRGYLSVLAQYNAELTYVRDVPSRSFWPAPKVDSAVIHMQLHDPRALPAEEETKFLRFVRSMFIQPRKQLKNVLAGIRGVSNTEASEFLQAQELSEYVRAQEITVEQWIRLYQA